MWVPANDIEQHMREALRAGQQEDYFRLLARAELLLPFAEETSPSQNGTGSWATWATEERTHVLVFTSPEAMRACLHAHAGAFRTVRFGALADSWPDSEWWLAVDPGTPIEGYLPAWFVRQVAVGDIHLPEDHGQQAQPQAPMHAAPGQPPDRFGQFESSPFQAEPFQSEQFPSEQFPSEQFQAGTPRYGDTAPPAASLGPNGLPRREPAAESAGLPRREAPADTGGLPRREAPPSDGSGAPSSWDSTLSAGGLPGRQPAPPPDAFGASPSWDPAADAGGGLPRRDVAADAGGLPRRDVAPPADGFGSSPTWDSGPAAGGYPTAENFDSPAQRPDYTQPMEAAGFGPAAEPAPSWEPAPPADSRPPAGSWEPPPAPDAYAAPAGSWEPPPAPDAYAAPAAPPLPPALPVPMSTSLPEWPGEEAVDEGLAHAASTGDTQAFLNVLLQAWAYLPVAEDCPPSARPGDPEFRWHTDLIDGAYTITAFTSLSRLNARYGDRPHINTTFGRLTAQWPGLEYSLYVNPSTEVGANIPGPQVTTLVTWARTQGLLQPALDMDALGSPATPAAEPVPAPEPAMEQPQAFTPELMQKVLPHQQVAMTLERGYDRVAGFVHRFDEVRDLSTPERLYNALGLLRDGVDFSPTDDSVHVIRWIGHRADLYRVAYGGNDPMTADRNGGWIVEPPPFSGDGYAPSVEGRRIIEFKVDSVRLPHGATMTRIGADGRSEEIAAYDSDRREWIRSDIEAAASSWDISPAGDFRQEQQHA
ncbi:MAG: SseB family protein [Stackebrandtia sp.]